MDDIELAIKIPKKVYNALTHTEFDANLVVNEMRKSIANGTPLPKGHGRLIDADKNIQVYEEIFYASEVKDCISDNDMYIIRNVLKNAPTIIEADNALI